MLGLVGSFLTSSTPPEFWHPFLTPQKGGFNTTKGIIKHQAQTPIFWFWTPHFPTFFFFQHHFFIFQHLPCTAPPPPKAHVLSQLRAGQFISIYIHLSQFITIHNHFCNYFISIYSWCFGLQLWASYSFETRLDISRSAGRTSYAQVRSRMVLGASGW